MKWTFLSLMIEEGSKLNGRPEVEIIAEQTYIDFDLDSEINLF